MRSAIPPSRSISAWLAFRASVVNRGRMLRKSELSKVVFSSIFPCGSPRRGDCTERNRSWSSSRSATLPLPASRPQRVFALKRSDWLDGMGTTYRLHAGFREAEVLDLAFLDEVLHRSRHVFDRHVRVDAVLIERIDASTPRRPSEPLGDLLDVLRPAIQANPPRPALGIEFEPELGGDHHLSAERSEALPTSSSFVNGP